MKSDSIDLLLLLLLLFLVFFFSIALQVFEPWTQKYVSNQGRTDMSYRILIGIISRRKTFIQNVSVTIITRSLLSAQTLIRYRFAWPREISAFVSTTDLKITLF